MTPLQTEKINLFVKAKTKIRKAIQQEVSGMDVKVKFPYNFLQKQVKKWDQAFLEPKFSLFTVKFKKLGFSAPLTV